MGLNEERLKEENIEEKDKFFGWDAITETFEKLYPGQENPKHYGTLISWRFGGNDPLPGISIYDGGDYWHFVTYGLSEVYEKETDNQEISGYGMEFTLKLKKENSNNEEEEEDEIKGLCGILQSIARITFTQGEVFGVYEYLYTGQTEGVDVKMESNITGFITVPEPKCQSIDTPNGKVEFVELIGVTDAELKSIMQKEISVKELYGILGSDVTSYSRQSVR